MSSFFEKLGEQTEKEIIDDLILFFLLYVDNNDEKSILEISKKLSYYDKSDIYSNISSEIIREALSCAANYYLNSIFKDDLRELPSIERAKEILKSLYVKKSTYEN